MYTYIIPAIVTAISSALAAWWGAYHSEKGKNQATKEDIAAITEIVENIKKDLNDKTEELKAKISVESEHKITMRSLEREAILQYYTAVSQYASVISRPDFTTIKEFNTEHVDKIYQSHDKLHFDLEAAEARLTFFIDDHEYLDIWSKVTKDLIEFRQFIINTVGALSILNFDYTSQLSQNNNLESVRSRELIDKFKSTIKDFYNQRTEKWGIVYTSQIELKHYLRNRLETLTSLS